MLRNTAASQARTDGRRQRREENAARPEAQDETPHEIRARVEQRQLLAEQLLELPENLRTALVLRFEEGLTGVEIAKRLGVPEGTVRWRLERGLERMREQLDRQHNGEREAWMRGLAPLRSVELVLGPEFASSARVQVLGPESGESVLHRPSGQRLPGSLEVGGARSVFAWLPADLVGCRVFGLDASGVELPSFEQQLGPIGASSVERIFTP